MCKAFGRTLAGLAIFGLSAAAAWSQEAAGENWPRWRGPLANGVSPAGDPPTKWSESENVRWKVAIPGKGSASPVIWGNKLFLLTAIPAGAEAAAADSADGTESVALLQPPGERRRGGPPGGRGEFGGRAAPDVPHEFTILCLDRNSGKTLWRQTARKEMPHEVGHGTNTFASASAVTDGRHVYASFGSRGIYCYDLNGKKVWEEDLGEMETRNDFGEGASPALHGDTLVVPWDHEGEDFVVALDARTGAEKWRTPRDEPTTWGTPLIVPRGDGMQVILNGSNRVRSYDLVSGELLWECGGQAQNPIPTPVANDRLVFATTGFRGYAMYAIPLDAKGDLTDSDKVAWKRTKSTPYVSSPVLSKGLLYFTEGRSNVLTCVEAATGKEAYTNARLPDIRDIYSSPVAAAGRIYFFSREGTGVVVREGREFEVLATNKLDETVDASPAIIGKMMYVRGEKSLYCLAEK